MHLKNTTVKLGSSLVSIGEGFPAISECLFQRIGEDKYIDFSKISPAKGKIQALPAQLDGQPILIPLQNATGETKKLIPGFPSCMGSVFYCLHCCNGFAASVTGTIPDGVRTCFR